MGALGLLALAACGSSEGETPSAQTDAAGIPIVRIEARYATALAADLETLVSSMDAAFVGEVIGQRPQREEPAVGRGATLPISVFEVRVAHSAGGPATGSTVLVEQVGGITTADGETVRVLLEGDTPIVPGARYLFIADRTESGAYSVTSFARFRIEHGVVRAPDGWEALGASVELAGTRQGSAMARVSDAR